MDRDMDAMGQSGRCIPQAEEVKTGLLVTVTFYTDQECTELFEPEKDQNRGPNNACFQLEEEECEEKEGCEFETEGNGRLSTPHCKPSGDRFQGGRGEGQEERPCNDECGDVAKECREDMEKMRERRAAMMAMRRCMMGFGDDDCAACLEENRPGDRGDDSSDEDSGRRRLQRQGEQGGRPQGRQGQGGQQGGRPGMRPNRYAGNQGRGQ